MMAEAVVNLGVASSAKVPRQDPNWNQCLCHVMSATGTLSPFTEQSWRKLQESAELRQDGIHGQLKGHWNEGPIGGYHRQCYQTYTNKTLIKRLLTKRESHNLSSEPSTSSEAEVGIQTRSVTLPTKLDECIFCHQGRRRVGGRREELSQCLTTQAEKTLKETAEQKHDQSILLQIRGKDLIAIEVKYHNSCYRKYTRYTKPSYPEDSEGYDVAFTQLVNFVQENIIVGLDVIKMTDLRDTYIDLLTDVGIHAPSYRTEKVKARLQRHFGDTLSFWQPQQRSETEIVFSKNVSTGQAVEAVITVASTSHVHVPPVEESEHNKTHQVFRCAQIIRAELMAVRTKIPWPPTPEDLVETNVDIPDLVYNLLAWVLFGESDEGAISAERLTLSATHHRHVMSIAQDLLHCISGGRVKTPKHVVLPLTVKHLTGSTQLIKILNHFGHTLSNSLIQEVDTAMAERQINRVEEGAIYTPPNIQPNVPVIMCWDNNDINEETLSGHGTTHCTNGIIIQRDVQPPTTAAAAPPSAPDIRPTRGKRKRSFVPLPSKILPYNAGKRCSPGNMPISNQELRFPTFPDSADEARLKDTAWCMLRSRHDEDDTPTGPPMVPGWSGFNAAVSSTIPLPSRVGYCPVIEASPTELSTVYILLKTSVQMGRKLGQEDVIIVMDLAIYAKAQEIVWKRPEEFPNVVLRMGAFHTAMTFIAILGKRFGDAGLSDLLIEAGIVAAGSISGVLEGRHYNRAMRAHKIIMEAMQRLRLKSFHEWMHDNRREEYPATRDELDRVCTNPSAETLKAMMVSPQCRRLLELYDEFCRSNRGKLAAFWDSYIDMVCLLLRFIRATREGIWSLHICSIREMVPWAFVYNRPNYARYMSVYWVHMVLLPQTHPRAYAMLKDGHFSVQRSAHSRFAQVPVDQTIEQTMNRDSKTKGGIVGMSLNQGAVQRWILTAHDRAKTLETCREMTGLCDADSKHHKDASVPRMRKDEDDVHRVMDTIESWVNPFTPRDLTEPLTNIASAVKATDSITNDLLTAEQKGNDAFVTFVEKRLQTSEVDLFAPLPKSKLQTFGDMVKSKKTKTTGLNVIIKADRGLFARMVVIAQHRQMNMQDVLKYPLGPLPWSLATPDGTPAKTTKATLLHLLEGKSDPVEEVPTSAVWIFDGMALLQSMKAVPRTFSELASHVFQLLISTSSPDRTRTDLIMDQYPEVSIKNPERAKRGAGGTIQIKIQDGSQKCPTQWKKFMSDGSNKTNLATFLVKEWQQQHYLAKFAGFGALYVTHGTDCHRLSAGEDGVDCSRVDELCTQQEEADTRILLHASHAAADGHGCIVIKSPDTDVAVLACTFSHEINARVLFCTGTKQRHRFIDITTIGQSIGEKVCRALPGVHAFTGCDSTSAFVGKGKKQALQLVESDPDLCSAMTLVGNSFEHNDERLEGCAQFVCSLYGHSGTSDTDIVRYKLFCNKNAQTCHLPPTKDALKYHVARANYQACIWRQCLDATAPTPSPDGHGWDVTDGNLSIHWMDQQPAPKALLQLISCNCSKDHCVGGRCTCRKSAMPCTDACGCDECTNTKNTGRMESDSSDED